MSHTSNIWTVFHVSAVDPSRAVCDLCAKSFSRGNKNKSACSYNTTNLWDHLESVHNEKWKELKKKSDNQKELQGSSASSSSKQQTISSAFDAKRSWSFDDERSRSIHLLLGEMIAVDDQAFNIVNNAG